MKNLLHNIQIWMMLALTMAGVQSCANDIPEMSHAEVSFTATLPNNARSRSFGNAEQVNTLVVGVFDNQYKEIYRKLYSIEGTSVNISLALAQSQTYHFIFWAYDNTLDVYDISDLKSIQMKALPASITFAQAEAMDAFFSIKEHVTVMGDKNYSIKLVRPLAQINVGTTGMPMLASLTAKEVPDTFHPFTNSVSGATDYNWNFSETITEKFSADGKEYNYLTIGYLFAPSTAISIATELTLFGEKSQTLEFPQVEIESNCKSNIAGKFTEDNHY